MKIREHTELEVYKKAFSAAMLIFETTKRFPKDEMYSLTDQIRRSSRSVCANLAEAWRKRCYKQLLSPSFVMLRVKPQKHKCKVQFAVSCGYLKAGDGDSLRETYDEILRTLVAMINRPQSWLIIR
jgi:hypothetical protein